MLLVKFDYLILEDLALRHIWKAKYIPCIGVPVCPGVQSQLQDKKDF